MPIDASLLEEKPSLLDASLGQLDRHGRPLAPLSRVVLVGRAAEGVTSEELGVWHEEQVSAVKEKVFDEEAVRPARFVLAFPCLRARIAC